MLFIGKQQKAVGERAHYHTKHVAIQDMENMPICRHSAYKLKKMQVIAIANA